MYCRQHGYPTAPLISYKITGIGTLWEVAVPLSELSITSWLSAEPLPSYRHETNHLRFQRHLRFRCPSPLHRSRVPGTGAAGACLSPCLPCRWCPVGQLAHLRSPLIGSALLLLQFKQNPMAFVSWSVHPLYDEQDKEFFTSEDHAVDVAYSWSAETHGRTMILQRDGIDWMEVVA